MRSIFPDKKNEEIKYHVPKKPTDIWKYKNMILNSSWVREKDTKQVKKYFVLGKHENTHSPQASLACLCHHFLSLVT